MVQQGDNVGIGGFIIQGSEPKRVILRAIGPSLNVNGVPVQGRLMDPYLELYSDRNVLIFANDNWRDSQEQQVKETGIAPTDNRESAIVATLRAGAYTAVLRGKADATGIGLAEIYDLETSSNVEFANLSGRAFVGNEDNVLIAGVILRGEEQRRVLFRAIGPEMRNQGVQDALEDPTLEVRDGDGGLVMSNDNWRDAPNAAEIEATGLQPRDNRESAVLVSLPPGTYTSIVRGLDNGRGVGLAEVYKLND